MVARKTITFAEALKVLGVDKYSSKESAQAAYRKLAAENHPDKVGQEGVEKMQRINAAWSYLKTQLKTQAEIDKAEAKKQSTAENDSKKKGKVSFSKDYQSVQLVGNFRAADLIDALYALSSAYMDNLGDVVKDASGMVDLFRAFSTGRKNKVFSLAYLDSKNRLIHLEELVIEKLTTKAVCTQSLLQGASKVYIVENSTDGSVPERLTKVQIQLYKECTDALDLVGIELVDHLIIGHRGHYSMTQGAVIPKVASTGPQKKQAA